MDKDEQVAVDVKQVIENLGDIPEEYKVRIEGLILSLSARKKCLDKSP
jgi:hypothetical protein